MSIEPREVHGNTCTCTLAILGVEIEKGKHDRGLEFEAVQYTVYIVYAKYYLVESLSVYQESSSWMRWTRSVVSRDSIT